MNDERKNYKHILDEDAYENDPQFRERVNNAIKELYIQDRDAEREYSELCDKYYDVYGVKFGEYNYENLDFLRKGFRNR